MLSIDEDRFKQMLKWHGDLHPELGNIAGGQKYRRCIRPLCWQLLSAYPFVSCAMMSMPVELYVYGRTRVCASASASARAHACSCVCVHVRARAHARARAGTIRCIQK